MSREPWQIGESVAEDVTADTRGYMRALAQTRGIQEEHNQERNEFRALLRGVHERLDRIERRLWSPLEWVMLVAGLGIAARVCWGVWGG